MKPAIRNLLGAIRAESDIGMLSRAFIETPDYNAITKTLDFNFIVGRRGTGKSALKICGYKYFYDKKDTWAFDIAHNDYDALKLQSTLSTISKDYRACKYIIKAASRVAIVFKIAEQLRGYYKRKKIRNIAGIDGLCARIDCKPETSFMAICNFVITKSMGGERSPSEIPYEVVSKFNVEESERAVIDSLISIGKNVVLFFDSLDEGWEPQRVDTAIIGGIAHAVADYKDRIDSIHAYMFVRDNMFRALASFDTDFTRNIECTSLRLKWDTDSLFDLITKRMRTYFDISVENNTKVWNRYAKNELSGRKGFQRCLARTLYRPRDIISLLNQSFAIAAKAGRQEIVEDDIEGAALSISQDRLKDLINEYDVVFPSIDILMDSFRGSVAPLTYEDATSLIDARVAEIGFVSRQASDFAILESGEARCRALFSVGFIGLQNSGSTNITFCHDGSMSNSVALDRGSRVWVHPCYWIALDISSEYQLAEVAERIYDDYGDHQYIKDAEDLRTKQLGQVISELGHIPSGHEGAYKFEDWVLRAVKILFGSKLSNPELHPNKDALSRRDVVARNIATAGFWSRVLGDYQSRQVVFDAKNYDEITLHDVRQLSDYLTGIYGNFGVLVKRSNSEGLTDQERGWVSRIYHEHKKIIFIVPSSILQRCIGKLRKSDRYDYAEDVLNKRLDTFERNYISLRGR